MDMQHSASKYNVMQYNTKINQEKRRVLSDLQSVLSAGCEQYIHRLFSHLYATKYAVQCKD